MAALNVVQQKHAHNVTQEQQILQLAANVLLEHILTDSQPAAKDVWEDVKLALLNLTASVVSLL